MVHSATFICTGQHFFVLAFKERWKSKEGDRVSKQKKKRINIFCKDQAFLEDQKSSSCQQGLALYLRSRKSKEEASAQL